MNEGKMDSDARPYEALFVHSILLKAVALLLCTNFLCCVNIILSSCLLAVPNFTCIVLSNYIPIRYC